MTDRPVVRPSSGAESDAAARRVALPVRSRFAQLTYTSFHREGGAGGWQVKDVRGDLDPTEQRALTARIGTRLAPATRLPTLPTTDERAALPHRLVYAETVQGAHAFWHTIPAGADSSGRPGNVFAHIVLDRRPLDPEPPLRSSDFLDAPQWLRPYGSTEVLATSLGDVPDPPWSGGVMSAESVMPFLVDAAVSRPAVLAAVLDAVADALDDGPPVVLGVEEPGHAELWIAGILHLMSPGTGRRMFWSTAEKAEGLAEPPSLHLAVVPLSSLDDLDPGELVLLGDDRDAVELGDLVESQPHRTRWGSTVPAGLWSVLAQEVLQDVDLASRTVASADRVAAAVGDQDLPCAWPLAMAVSLAVHELPDAQEEARQVLGASAPRGLLHAPELARKHRAALLGALGPTTADAFAAANGQVPGVDRGLAASVYLERALEDDAWLVRPEGVPLPGGFEPTPDDDPERSAAEALTRVASYPDGGLETAVRLLRLVDLISRGRLLDLSATGPVTDVLTRALDDVVGPLFASADNGTRLAVSVGPIADAVGSDILAPWLGRWLAGASGEPGSRLSPTVLMWVYPTPPAPPAVGALGTDAVSPLLVELAAQVTTVVPNPSAFRALALDHAVRCLVEDADPTYLTHLAKGPAFAAEELQALTRVHGVPALAVVLPHTLRSEPAGEEIDRLVDLVRDAIGKDVRGPLGTVRRLAELRFHASTWSTGEWAGEDRDTLEELMRGADDLLVDHPDPPAASVVRAVLVAVLVELVDVILDGFRSPDRRDRRRITSWLERWCRESSHDAEEHVREDLEHALERRVVNEVALGAAAVAATALQADPDQPSTVDREWTSLIALGDSASIVDDLLARRLRRRPAETVEEFLSAVHDTVRRVVADPRRLPRDLDRTTRERWGLLPAPARPRRPWGRP